MLKDEIKRSAQRIYSEVIANRRHLHAHPELSFCEYETSGFIKRKLDEMEISWKEMAETEMLAMMQGEKASKGVIALRADIDALPITEATDVSYASQNTGIMHA